MHYEADTDYLLPDEQTLDEFSLFDEEMSFDEEHHHGIEDENGYDSPESVSNWLEEASHRFIVT